MPIYEYEHRETPCERGAIFEVKQSMRDTPLTRCPTCNGPVRKIISRPNVNMPTSNTDLRDKGFTKLVRRDKGVYENVTATEKGEMKVRLPREEKKPKTYELPE